MIARCALTFLPITEPGFSKQCVDCDREFLNERLHQEMLNVSNPLEGWPSLARVLFDKFDVCPYCGGKYQD